MLKTFAAIATQDLNKGQTDPVMVLTRVPIKHNGKTVTDWTSAVTAQTYKQARSLANFYNNTFNRHYRHQREAVFTLGYED